MRWKLSLTAPLISLVVLASQGGAQGHPLTVTIPPYNHTVRAVLFPDLTDSVYVATPPDQIQYFVADVGPDLGLYRDGRYRIRVQYRVGEGHGHIFEQVFSFAPTSTCTDPEGYEVSEGSMWRLACAVVEKGRGVTCSAIYDAMDNPPEPSCKGSHACKRCDGMKVCGSDPECY